METDTLRRTGNLPVIHLTETDNVAIARTALDAGVAIDDRGLMTRGKVPAGYKVALRDLKRIQQLEGQSLGRLVSDLLAQSLATRQSAPQAPTPFTWISQPMGARVDLRDKDAVLDAMDEPRK